MIITGGGSGLGKELALLFSQQGFHILMAGRNYERLSAARLEIEGSGGTADIIKIDIRNPFEIEMLKAELNSTYDIYGLVNNAGIGHFGPFTEMSDERIKEMLDTNILGTILMTKTILPMLLQNGEGRLINIISTAGLRGKVNEAVYAASKFAIRGFTESLQKEFENSRIKINAVYMGGMDTPFWKGSDHVKDTSRFRLPKEVAQLIFDHLDEESIIIESKKS
ncbi:SDR family NAD(P)-dependent oxidoreductase [Bacillus sp. MRMR6]|uniref:SDR family NAD(P)-dependent oxidoreductase n=1 Tax=Bacillus sp. MRMR6 TaxID=1928617 RepID=UPI0034C5EF08